MKVIEILIYGLGMLEFHDEKLKMCLTQMQVPI